MDLCLFPCRSAAANLFMFLNRFERNGTITEVVAFDVTLRAVPATRIFISLIVTVSAPGRLSSALQDFTVLFARHRNIQCRRYGFVQPRYPSSGY